MNLLEFELSGARCALPASQMVEVQRAVALTPLPRSPPVVEGVINLRGKLVPVIDIRTKLGLPAQPLSPSNHMLIVQTSQGSPGAVGRTLAIRVDRALELLSVPEELIEDPRPIAGAVHAAGMAKLPDGMVVIHDLRTFLSLDEVFQLDRALPESGA